MLSLSGCVQDLDHDDADHADDADASDLRKHEFPVHSIGDDLPSVPALSEEEVAQLREGAAAMKRPVRTTEGTLADGAAELAPLGSDDNPALHYAMIEIRSQREAAALTELGIHVEAQPLFGEEYAEPAKESPLGILREPGHDAKGVFVFAVLPASLYEGLMTLALGGDPVFPTIVLRAVPDETHRDKDETLSRLSWAMLLESGHEWIPFDEDRPVTSDKIDVEADAKYWETVAALRTLTAADMKAIASAFVPIAGGNNNKQVAIHTIVKETDPTFRGSAADGTDRDMVRAWGPTRGGPVDLRGISLVANPGSGTKRRGVIGAQNAAVLNLRTDRAYGLCLELAAPAAKVMVAPPLASQVCFSGAIDTIDPSLVLEIRHHRLGWLVQAIEGYTWMTTVAQLPSMHRAKILAGPVADLISTQTASGVEIAYAPCAGLFGAKWLQLVPGLTGIVGGIADVFFNIDIVMPGDASNDFNLSRAGFSHEYGHIALCGLMRHGTALGATDSTGGRLRFEWAWQDMIIHTAGNRGIEDESSWINEAFADVFASQVAGGVNYLEPSTPDGHIIDNGGNMRSCDARFDDCMETNQEFPDLFGPNLPTQSDDLFRGALTGFVGVMHDMLDGHPTSVGLLRPNNGAAWKAIRDEFGEPTGREAGAFEAPRQNDEVVHVTGAALVTMFRAWSDRGGSLPTLRLANVLPAAVDAMKAQNVPDPQICNLVELHLASGDCSSVAPGVDLDLDPVGDATIGDLFAPTAPACTFPAGQDQMRCVWEDLSLGGVAYEVTISDADTLALVSTTVEPYSVFAEHFYDFPADADALRIEVRTRVADGRLSAPGVAIKGVPQAPPAFGCGNGIVEFPEQCDGPVVEGAGNSCEQGCVEIEYCVACEVVLDCEC